ncbi:hypothetical protein [Saccharopolyspora erythraea]|uniref:hypothetical protein n=1 Tax=Saccharopolyspora erythraea TaxID=1836 RepID=UPI0020124BC9|nr:hypothetical protein [Saccharopolyspora erythraea]
MRRIHTAVGAGVLFFAISACAQQPADDVGFGGNPPAPPPAPVAPKPVDQRTPVPQQQLSPGAPKTWTQDDGSVVVATGSEGGCSKVHAELLEQNAQQVKIRLVDETPEPAGICTMDLRYPPLAVKLDAPLDQRQVVIEEVDVKVPR